MTSDTPQRRRWVAPLVAALAFLAGATLLVLGVMRFLDLLDEEETAAPSPTTTAATTSSSGSTVTGDATFDATEFVAVTDDSDRIRVMVPRSWSDVSGRAWVVDGSEVGHAISVAPDVDAWYSTWGTPGLFVGVSSQHSPTLGDFSPVCVAGNLSERQLGELNGEVQAWSDCGDEASSFYVFVGGPPDSSYQVLAQMVVTDGSGIALFDAIIDTLSYDQ